MYNFIIPYISKVLETEYILIQLEKNMIDIFKNENHKAIFDDMLSNDKEHIKNIENILKDLGFSPHRASLPPIKSVEMAEDGIGYLISLKKNLIQIYKDLNNIQIPQLLVALINKMYKKEFAHIELLEELKSSIKSTPYCTTVAIDLAIAYRHLHDALKFYKSSYSNEESEDKRNEIKELMHSLRRQMEDLLNLIKSYTNSEIGIHELSPNDTLWRVSKKYNCNAKELETLNSIENPYEINKNNVLLIPNKETPD